MENLNQYLTGILSGVVLDVVVVSVTIVVAFQLLPFAIKF